MLQLLRDTICKAYFFSALDIGFKVTMMMTMINQSLFSYMYVYLLIYDDYCKLLPNVNCIKVESFHVYDSLYCVWYWFEVAKEFVPSFLPSPPPFSSYPSLSLIQWTFQ
jgi:hypothetical protein